MSNPITTNFRVIAAICGNFYQESTVNPGIWENLTVGAPGYGLGQWTDNAQVSRRTALFNWLSANGYAQDSGDGQLAFLIYENVWLTAGAAGPARFSSLSDFLSSTSTNLEMLTGEFMHSWEGIDDGTLPVRLEFAEIVLDRFLNDSGNRWPWYTSNSYNSRVYAYRNSMRILDFFLGNSPQPGPGPTDDEILAVLAYARKKKMKIGGIILEP